MLRYDAATFTANRIKLVSKKEILAQEERERENSSSSSRRGRTATCKARRLFTFCELGSVNYLFISGYKRRITLTEPGLDVKARLPAQVAGLGFLWIVGPPGEGWGPTILQNPPATVPDI